MDTRTGEIYRLTGDELAEAQRLRKMEGRNPLLEIGEQDFQELQPMERPQRKNWMRNKPCPCGSGKKFKRCHWSAYA